MREDGEYLFGVALRCEAQRNKVRHVEIKGKAHIICFVFSYIKQARSLEY